MEDLFSVKHLALLIGYVAWQVRLEAKVIFQDEKIKEVKEKVKNENNLLFSKIDNLQKSVNDLNNTVARMDERLKNIERD